MWTALILASLGCYLLKLAGLSIPARVLAHPRVERADETALAAISGAIGEAHAAVAAGKR